MTQITLDPAGNEIKLVDPDGNATNWTYSPTNLPLTETNSLGTTTTTYNLDHEVTSIEDADGRLRDFVYDNDQRLTAENWMNGSTVVASMNYSYDLDNELTSASDPNSAYAFAYNGDGQVTSVDNKGTLNVPDVVLTSGYDLMDDRTSLAATIAGTADFSNTYAYDADQNLTMVQQQGVKGGNAVAQKEIDYAYNALGQFTGAADYNYIGVGPRTDVLAGAYSYDNDARLTGIAYTSGGGATTIDTLGWGYDAASNVTSFSSLDGTATYGYDPTNQLTSATYTTASGGHQPANENFSFDANGNRNMTGYTTGADNLMSSDGTYNYKYDADGNTISRTQIASTYSTQYLTTYTWDYRNRLTDVDYYDNNNVLTKHVHYVYGVFDHLLATEVDPTGGGSYTQIQHYVFDVSPETPLAGVPGTSLAQPDLVFDGNGNLIQRNLVTLNPAGVDAVVAQESVNASGNVVTWMADGHLGSPVDVVNNSGTEDDHIVRSAFGQVAYESNSAATPWAGFGGGHLDPNTGLINDYHRWLNTADGVWLNQDSSGFRGGDTNLTRYSGNAPTGEFDPLGLAATLAGLEQELAALTKQVNGIFTKMENLAKNEAVWRGIVATTPAKLATLGVRATLTGVDGNAIEGDELKLTFSVTNLEKSLLNRGKIALLKDSMEAATSHLNSAPAKWDALLRELDGVAAQIAKTQGAIATLIAQQIEQAEQQQTQKQQQQQQQQMEMEKQGKG